MAADFLLNKKRTITQKLIAYFLCIGVLTTALIGILSYQQSKNNLEENSFEKLVAVREIKKNQIQDFFKERQSDLSVFTKNYAVVEGLHNLKKIYHAAGPESAAYDSLEQTIGTTLSELKNTYGYYDLFLISPMGDIIYTVEKEADFATNLLRGPYRHSNLAKVFKASKNNYALVDFEKYEPSNGAPAFFMAAPVYDDENKFIGVLALQISLHEIDKIMNERSGLGESGETYLVGPDHLMRSDSRFSSQSTVLVQEIDTKAVQEALEGNKGYQLIKDYRGEQVLSAYDKLNIEGLEWVIITEIDHAEVLIPVHRLRNWYLAFGLFICALVTIVAVIISRRFTDPINTIRQTVMKLAQGEITKEVNVPTNDEIAEMAQDLNSLTKNIKKMTLFATDIGKGKLDTPFTPMSEKDTLGQALLTMRDELLEVETATQKRNWINKGLTNISGILKKHKDNMEECTQQVINEIIQYTGANQGAIYLLNDEKQSDVHMSLIACYAWNQPKYLTDKVLPGVGLVGQCWLEKNSIFLREVPQDYIQITSGLGKSLPQCIFIVPMIVNDEVFGVLEMAFFDELDEYTREFITNVCEDVASALSSTKIYENTRNLLQKVQQQTEELKAQEEEVRQNMEELSATQEEMVRQKKEMEKEIIELRKKLEEA